MATAFQRPTFSTEDSVPEPVGQPLAPQTQRLLAKLQRRSCGLSGMLKAGVILDGLFFTAFVIFVAIAPEFFAKAFFKSRNPTEFFRWGHLYVFCWVAIAVLYGIATPLYLIGSWENDRRRGLHRPGMWAFQCIFQTVIIPLTLFVFCWAIAYARLRTLTGGGG